MALPRRRTASLPVLVSVFGAVFAALFVGAATRDQGASSQERQRRAFLEYESAVLPAAREAGAAIVLGVRPDITDFRSGRITPAVFRNDMVARGAQFDAAARAIAAAPVPPGLEQAAAIFQRSFLHYRMAVVALHEAGDADGAERESLLALGAGIGNAGDELYDRAGTEMQRARRSLGLPPSSEWPE